MFTLPLRAKGVCGIILIPYAGSSNTIGQAGPGVAHKQLEGLVAPNEGVMKASVIVSPANAPLCSQPGTHGLSLVLNFIGLSTTGNCYDTSADQNDYRESRDPHCPKHDDGQRRCALNESP